MEYLGGFRMDVVTFKNNIYKLYLELAEKESPLTEKEQAKLSLCEKLLDWLEEEEQ